MKTNFQLTAACVIVAAIITAAWIIGDSVAEERAESGDAGWTVLDDGKTAIQEMTTESGTTCFLVRHHLTVTVSCQ